jgi:hypothetical protein
MSQPELPADGHQCYAGDLQALLDLVGAVPPSADSVKAAAVQRAVAFLTKNVVRHPDHLVTECHLS